MRTVVGFHASVQYRREGSADHTRSPRSEEGSTRDRVIEKRGGLTYRQLLQVTHPRGSFLHGEKLGPGVS